MTFQEAIASKLLVLAKYDNSLDSLIIDKETGFFYDSTPSLADLIDEVLNIDDITHERIVDAAFKLNSSLYSKDNFYKRIMHVYKKAQRDNF